MAESESGGKGLIRGAKVSTMSGVLKFTNFIAGALMVATGVVGFINLSLDVPTVLLAVYVIIFGLLIVLFEMRLKRFDIVVFKTFGFMFTWKGRCLFQLFVGTLAFGLGILGIITGIYCILNLLFTGYVMSVHPTLGQVALADAATRQAAVAGTMVAAGAAQAQQMAGQALGAARSAATSAAADARNAAQQASASAQSAMAKASAGAGGAGTGAGAGAPSAGQWEKLYDEDTKRFYYHNPATSETRWDDPSAA